MPWVVVCALLAPSQVLSAPRVQVRGSSRIEMQAFGPVSRLTITGTVRDEVGAPIPKARIVLAPLAAPDVPDLWKSIYPCGQSPASSFVEHSDHALDVDDAGTWCVIASLGRDHATLRATFGGDSLHEGTRSDIVWDAAQRAMTVSFSPRPERVDLDLPRQRVFAHITVPPDVGPSGIALELKDERGELLGSARTDEAGIALFDLATAKLQGPGIGALHVGFPGSASLAATSTSTAITRYAHVKLEPVRDPLQGDPSSGLLGSVRVTTSRGPISGGTVEALFGADVVGSGVVREGESDVSFVFAPPRGAELLKLTLRYVSDTPYFVAGEPGQITIRAVRSGVALRFVPVLLAIGVAAWLLRGWRRPKRLERADTRAAQPKGVASIEVVGSSRAAPHWSGRVVDAHDGEPVASARIRVIAPSFVDLDVVCETHTDGEGRFSFDLNSAARELKLRIEAPLHTELNRPLPAPSELAISLVSRRRTLLQRLVEWARRAGKPWDQPPEPTPGHVVRVATAHHRRDEIATWAENTERKAYGPDPVDARAEREVKAMEPGRQALR